MEAHAENKVPSTLASLNKDKQNVDFEKGKIARTKPSLWAEIHAALL